jgi:phage tail P2-like protein
MNFDSIDLLSLQTSYLQQDTTVQAICNALNPYFQILADSIKYVLIYGRIDELDDEAIDELAWQFHVDFYDASLSIEIKRKLIKKSIWLHRIKGTPQAVIDAATTVFGRTKLKEWFEYEGNPYYFKLDVDVTEQGASVENINKLDELVNAYKNTRSWVDVINIFFSSQCTMYFGTTSIQGEQIITYPWVPSNIEDTVVVKIAVSQISGNETIMVYPQEEVS